MEELYWFGITVTFGCQVCHKTSEQKLVMSHARMAPEEIKAATERQFLMCRKCKNPIVIGTQVLIHVLPGTPQELMQMGFVVPAHALMPPLDKQN